MSKKVLLVIAVVLLAIILSGCTAPTQKTDQGVSVERKLDSNLYHLILKISSDVGSYSQIEGSISGGMAYGYGSVSGAIWTEGKGLVRGTLLDLYPTVSFAQIGDEVIVKTTDFKIVALWPDDIVYLTCTADYEPICSLEGYENLGTGGVSTNECEDTWEFDYCRMTGFEPATQPEPSE
jgi:hypothetical protein